tara:strand:- start:65011 stop:65259 length:249 start_codon:yes stop_codon:yes gene_type:complete
MRKRLTKIHRDESLAGGLRTDSVEGECTTPVVGECLLIYAKPLEGGFIRQVNTSPIERIEENDDCILLHTLSKSIYKLEDVK